ncbi:MAG: hypothetical protein HY235_00855 [Acidobacteria bacterium]|nr:hypothetical protein [Acidobacteriota bacterium]
MRRTLAGLFLFSVSFAYIEAAVVVYLRAIYEPLRQQLIPGRPAGDVFPLIERDRLRAAAPDAARLLNVELVREAATLVMLAAAALLVAGDRELWLPSLAVIFGIWDLCFYGFLRLWTGWPESLLTWDLLFLIPVPWVAPVLAPVLVSLALVACGLAALRQAVSLRRWHWAGLILGGVLILLSFLWDSQHVMAGNLPRPFRWPLFSIGEALGVGAFVHALGTTKQSRNLQR